MSPVQLLARESNIPGREMSTVRLVPDLSSTTRRAVIWRLFLTTLVGMPGVILVAIWLLSASALALGGLPSALYLWWWWIADAISLFRVEGEQVRRSPRFYLVALTALLAAILFQVVWVVSHRGPDPG